MQTDYLYTLCYSAVLVPLDDARRIGIMLADCSSMIRNTSPRPCPVLLIYPHYA